MRNITSEQFVVLHLVIVGLLKSMLIARSAMYLRSTSSSFQDCIYQPYFFPPLNFLLIYFDTVLRQLSSLTVSFCGFPFKTEWNWFFYCFGGKPFWWETMCAIIRSDGSFIFLKPNSLDTWETFSFMKLHILGNKRNPDLKADLGGQSDF